MDEVFEAGHHVCGLAIAWRLGEVRAPLLSGTTSLLPSRFRHHFSTPRRVIPDRVILVLITGFHASHYQAQKHSDPAGSWNETGIAT